MSRKKSYPLVFALLFAMILAASLAAWGRAAGAGSTKAISGAAAQNIVPSAYVPLMAEAYCPDYFDDFSDPNSGWPVGTHSVVEYGYDSGEYRIYAKSDRYVFLIPAPACPRGYYNVAVDGRWAGTPGDTYGILFCIAGDFEQYYLFEVNSVEQKYQLRYWSSAGWETVVSPTFDGAIHSGNASNRLEVAHDGCSAMVLTANDVPMQVVLDNRISGLTRAGVTSTSNVGQARSDARFDNFAAWVPPLNSPAAAAIGSAERTGSDFSFEGAKMTHWQQPWRAMP